MLQNYILYLGGCYGDLTEAIVNNGITLHPSLKDLLGKNSSKLKDLQSEFSKNLFLSLNIKTISGHSHVPCNWGLNNYNIIMTKKENIKLAIKRFYLMYGEKELDVFLKFCYHENITIKLDKITIEKKLDLCLKQYENSINNFDDNIQTTSINLDNIYSKDLYFKELQKYFDFDTKISHQIYDMWQEKEKKLFL